MSLETAFAALGDIVTQKAFVWGALGSASVEVLQFLAKDDAKSRKKYRQLGFYVGRGLLVGISGALPLAYEATSNILAFHIGASAPVLISQFSQNPPGGTGENGAAA